MIFGGIILSKKTKQKQRDVELYYFIPLAFILAFIPLIVYLRIIPLQGIVREYWTGEEVNYDFFSYYKSVWLIISTILAIIMLLICKFTNRIEFKKTKLYIPIVIYSLFATLSTVLSKYTDVALKGFPERYEGMWVLLCYMAILVITINMVQNEKHIKFLLGALLLSTTIICAIGATQFFGYDIFNTDFGKKLILPAEYEHIATSLKFHFENSNVIYTTLLNSNYVASFIVLILPLTLAYTFLSKSNKKKLLSGIITMILSFILIGSRSRGGLVGLICSLITMIFYLRKEIFKNVKFTFISLIALVLIFLFINTTTNGVMLKRIKLMIPQEQTSSSYMLKDIKILGNKLKLEFVGESINIIHEMGKITFIDDQGKEIPTITKYPEVSFNDPIYNKHRFQYREMNDQLYVYYNNLGISFHVSQMGFTLLNEKNAPVIIHDIDKFGFEGYETAGSDRGYIWSRTLPLLKETMIIGFGPDTYALKFPQHDYVGKLQVFRKMGIIVDKPHNMYLQTGVNTGIISLMAILIIFGIYIYNSIKVYNKATYTDYKEIIGIGILFSIISYLVTGLFNDSVVSVAPVFWILLGIGVSINTILKVSENSVTKHGTT